MKNSDVHEMDIAMTGKEYLLYLRAHQEQMEHYILECVENAKGHRLSETEILELVEKKFRCELPVDDKDQVILKGVLTNLLDRYEVQGCLMAVSTKYGPGYQLAGKKREEAA